MYLGCGLWAVHYDTIYGHQDKADDPAAGVKSTALLFGDWTPSICGAHCVIMVSLWVYSAYNAGATSPYVVAGFAGAIAHLVWQFAVLDIDNPAICGKLFRSQKWAGASLVAGFLADAFLVRS